MFGPSMRISLSDREAEFMDVLWERGPSTVAEVREERAADLASTTVLTILRNLEVKRYVRHEIDGRAHRYAPMIGREAARRSALDHLASKLFKGSPHLLLAHMVADGKLTDAEVRNIRKLLAEHGRQKS
jgi:BlaI family transcriptional regulator, penicillinase repressor